MKVNIGAGKTYIPGFTNVDIAAVADVVLDLNVDSLPFADDSVDLIFSYHAIEHVENYLFALGEIHRVLRHGGHFLLGVPYVTLTEHNLVNPYHKQNFNEYSFSFFDAEELHGSAAEESAILFRKVFHRYHYMGGFNLLPPFLKTPARRHLFNVVRKIDFGLVAVKEPHGRLDIGADLERKMREEFLQCCNGRVSYGAEEEAGSDSKRGSKKRVRQAIHQTRRWWRGTDF